MAKTSAVEQLAQAILDGRVSLFVQYQNAGYSEQYVQSISINVDAVPAIPGGDTDEPPSR